jgi:hypothetical protein
MSHVISGLKFCQLPLSPQSLSLFLEYVSVDRTVDNRALPRLSLAKAPNLLSPFMQFGYLFNMWDLEVARYISMCKFQFSRKTTRHDNMGSFVLLVPAVAAAPAAIDCNHQ